MNNMEEIIKQFPKLTENQVYQFEKLQDLYQDWMGYLENDDYWVPDPELAY